ncbi:phosphoesterase PA-phosphatase-like protein [Methylobacterium sp. ME121]|nr:phosphoesterase PA-phosphatase-like protein [Methylobacterium sp. ME121]
MPGVTPYALPGPQVEPEASFWPRCPVLHPIRIEDLRARLDGKIKGYDTYNEKNELDELVGLYNRRETTFPATKLSRFLRESKYFTCPPAGAVLPQKAKKITNGVELATLFEAETPGLWHRHVLNVLLDPTIKDGPGQVLAPPRQALIWAALDLAIMSALAAAWHFKWLATGQGTVEYRRRPYEYAVAANRNDFHVLFDFKVDLTTQPGKVLRTVPKTMGAMPSPGTPRHPAYPSGHSTYSAAASEVLGCLFPEHKNAFRKLADDIGTARLYGGVHWRSDHTLGQQVGKVVGELVIAQLNQSVIPAHAVMHPAAPQPAQLVDEAREFGEQCGNGKANFCNGIVPPHPQPAALQSLQVM